VNIPDSMFVRRCVVCGAWPIVALVSRCDYTVKCPENETHYHTEPGLIDLEEWNLHNKGEPLINYSAAS